MKTKFKIGDKIRVKDVGQGYTTYTSMYKILKLEDSKPYDNGTSVPFGCTSIIKNIGEHECGSDTIILFEHNDKSYLISVTGVERVEQKVYFIIDGSGSMDFSREMIKLTVETMSKDYDCSKIIVHSTEAKFGTIDDIEQAGGTYLSSGLSLALSDTIMHGSDFANTTFVMLTDGDNWSEDNEKFINSLKFAIDSNVNVKYIELRPSTYVVTMYNKLRKEEIDKANFSMEQILTMDKLRDRLGLAELNEYTVYEIEHKVNGKRYNFRSNCQLREGEIAVCKTTYGYCYGLIKAINKVSLTKTAYKKLKKCTYLSDDIKNLKRR